MVFLISLAFSTLQPRSESAVIVERENRLFCLSSIKPLHVHSCHFQLNPISIFHSSRLESDWFVNYIEILKCPQLLLPS